MKQISISISDFSYKILVYISENTGKSQSAICAPIIEGALTEEIRILQEQMEILEGLEKSKLESLPEENRVVNKKAK